MLTYTKRPQWKSRAALLDGASISCETVELTLPVPADISSEHLTANEVFEMDLVTEGGGECRVFGQAIPCKRGDIFVIPPDIPHNCYVNERGERLQLFRMYFDIRDWFDGSVLDIGSANYCYGIFGGSVIAYAALNAVMYEKLTVLAEGLAREIREKKPNWEHAVRAYLQTAFIALGRYIGEAEHSQTGIFKEWHNIGVAVRIVMENFGNSELKLESVADALYISKSHLSRLFKEFTGEAFSVYLRGVRLNHACKLLRESDMTVEQIANACGMRDINSFYKNFQSIHGTTPNQYRSNKKTAKEKGERIMVVLSEISEKLQQGRGKIVAQLVEQALSEGADPEKILNEGLLAGMDIIGEKFRNNEIFVPEVLVAARAMNMGSQILKPHLAANGVQATGKVCIGTVQGDLHDIGKNLVKMMMEGKGLEVVDLGTDVPAETFVKTAIEENCRVICCSALLTTTMHVMDEVVKAAEAAGIRDKVKIMIGGAPVSDDFCKQIGADLYTADAASAANAAVEFCK
ncbi:MAG: helix-turn-helix domain-containing protein [Clostridia bacterium]|nr:helix-turn-helix domain-containing protein [Clostridia bacterium]